MPSISHVLLLHYDASRAKFPSQKLANGEQNLQNVLHSNIEKGVPRFVELIA